MTYYSTKTYDHNEGLSCAFRQWRAKDSHCRWIHGYALAVKFTFGCKELDDRNWAVDFGSLRPLKGWLEDMFDHKVCLDMNDPFLDKFRELEKLDLAEVRIFDGVGAEKFAEHAFNYADKLIRQQTNNRCWVTRVVCAEHGANSAIVEKEELYAPKL